MATEGFTGNRWSPEQQGLWKRVEDLWALSVKRDPAQIRAALHPRYIGWDTNQQFPHDREAAVRSVSEAGPRVTGYHLTPHAIEVYERRVGIVHYAYSATVEDDEAPTATVTGRWTEIYLKQKGTWVMIGVSGRPGAGDEEPGARFNEGNIEQ